MAFTGPSYPNASTNWDGDKSIAYCGDGDGDGGCLFELMSDPTEHSNLAQRNIAKLAQLKQILKAHSGALFSPDRGGPDPAACAAASGRYQGFWGSFVDV